MRMNLRSALKAMVESLGLKPAVERGFLESGLVGERLQFLFRSRPGPSQAILLAGSGRSGTTWLADLICSVPGTQQVFEPLRELARWLPAGAPPYPKSSYLRPEGHYPYWYTVLQCVLTGQSRTYWTDSVRTSFFPKRYLVKEIRANLMLGYIHDHFHPRIVYLSRHPCAIVASRVRLGWRVNLDDLLSQEELIEDHLARWVGRIERAKTNPVMSHAIWCAVESLVATSHLSTRRHCHAYYEHLLASPEASLREVVSWLGLDPRSIPAGKIGQDSHTTWREGYSNNRQDAEQRLSSWKGQLSKKDQREILDWHYRLDVMSYTDEVLPVTS
jgi:hypothetical protein